MMRSRETTYLENELATGFVRPYENHDYSFVALLPKEGVSLGELVAGLDGPALQGLLTPIPDTVVDAGLPKFGLTYDVELSSQLKALGMTDAFDADAADFSRMGTSEDGNLLIGQVLHKTHVDVDEKGSRAAAASSIGMESASSLAPSEPEVRQVILDRPFLYLITDARTQTPVFIGTAASLG